MAAEHITQVICRNPQPITISHLWWLEPNPACASLLLKACGCAACWDGRSE